MHSYASYTDQELTALLRSGDREAFSEVYRRYWPLLFRHARKMLQLDEAAKDIVQDVFIALWAASAKFDEHTILSPYLYACTRNRILNYYRHNKTCHDHLKSLGEFMAQPSNVTDHLARERMLARQIEEEIEKLPPRMREVFELKRRQHLSYKEIAVVMDISELTVKTQMTRAISILRGRLGSAVNGFLLF